VKQMITKDFAQRIWLEIVNEAEINSKYRKCMAPYYAKLRRVRFVRFGSFRTDSHYWYARMHFPALIEKFYEEIKEIYTAHTHVPKEVTGIPSEICHP